MKYIVWCPDYGMDESDAYPVDAADHEQAATTWAKRYDSDSSDYTIVSGTPADVMVSLDCDGAQVYRFTVTGESCPVYSAKAI